MQDSPPEHQGFVLLIDENLADRVLAQALKLVDYNAASVTEHFGPGALDSALIQWLGFQGGIWVTADERAKYRHAEEIRRAGIHIIWVGRRRDEKFSKRAQLLLLLSVIDDILQEMANAKGPAQFRAYYHGKRPKWERLY